MKIFAGLIASISIVLAGCGGGGGGSSDNFKNSFSISIPAVSTPWNVEVNPNLPYGEYGASNSSAVIFDLKANSIAKNSKIFIQCIRGETYLAKPASELMRGNCNGELNAIRESHSIFPSLHVSKYNSIVPFKAMMIIGSFANDYGVVIGSPFYLDSSGLILFVPEGATKILFGFNDVYFIDNSGGLEIAVKF